MQRVVIENLGFGFSLPLFERASVEFLPGWTGVVGENGSGKTTLLRLIAGELAPSSGTVQVTPAGQVGWCRQQSHEQRPELEDFAREASKPARRWRGQLELEAAPLERFEQLSAGERKRWQLAWALSREPDVLLLDEPTNHLDAKARELIVRALQRFRGVGILVSHDRGLLEALTERTARLHRRSVELWSGPYGEARRQWQHERERTLDVKAALQRTQARLAQRADEQRRRASGAERDRSARRRMKDKNDHDARSILSKNKAEAAGRRLARDAAALESRRQRVQAELGSLHVDKQLGRELFAEHAPWPKPRVFHLAFEALHAGSRRLLGRTVLDIGRADKLWLAAPNGSGKTTLIGELASQNPRVFAEAVYLPQHLPARARGELAARLRALGTSERGRVLSFVAALGSDPDALLLSEAWSPGQTRKLTLALGLARQTPALVLDEPTNHFDLPSIERLERLLVAFPGCVLLVTHDEALAERVATRVVRIDAGELVEGDVP